MAKRKTMKQPIWRKYLPVLIILAVAGGFGVWKLVDSFAATGLTNGNIYVGSRGYFTNQNLGNLTATVGYGTNVNDEPIFSPLGNTVAYVDYVTQEDFDNHVMSLMTAKSNGTAETLVYRDKPESNEWLDAGSISWSRDGKFISYITTISTTDGNALSRFINVVKPDGTGLKQFGFSYNASSNEGGSLREATFSGNNPNVIYYISYGMLLCSLDIVSEARKCNDEDIIVANSLPSSYQQIDFYRLKASGNYIYSHGYERQYKDDGSSSASTNVFRIDVGSNSALNITNFPLRQLDDTTPQTTLTDIEPSPDGNKVFYNYSTSVMTNPGDSNSWHANESKLMAINPDGSSPVVMQDNLSNPKLYIHSISWQPRSAGIEAPLPAPRPGGATYSISELKLDGIAKKGSSVTPKFDIINSSVVPREFAITVTRTMNGASVNQGMQVSVGAEQTKTVQLASFTVPYSKDGWSSQESGNNYSVRITNLSDGTDYNALAKQFALPMPPFSLSSVGSSVTVKKGTVVTFRGKTLPKKQVFLSNKAISKDLGLANADADGKYVINYTAKDTRVVKVCLSGYFDIAAGCKKVKINVH